MNQHRPAGFSFPVGRFSIRGCVTAILTGELARVAPPDAAGKPAG